MATCQINWSAYFRYEPETGKLYWVVNRSRLAKAGSEAGTNHHSGYIQIKIKGRMYQAHRIIWDILHPDNPLSDTEEIDHIDHIRSNNRPGNLRKVIRFDNMRNKSEYRNNTSGATGVYWHSVWRRWQAKIRIDGVDTFLGNFDDKHAAIAARKAAEIKYGFHKNHGKSS